MKQMIAPVIAVFALSLLLGGCTATRSTSFIHPEFDFGVVERAAIIPFENLSTEQGTASYVTRVFMTELLASGAFDVVEPGEVTRVIGTVGPVRAAEMPLAQIKRTGADLGVQALIFGSVGESAPLRGSTGQSAHAISIDVRMVDTENGATVWSAVVNTGGPGLFGRLFGTGEQSRSAAVRKAVRKAISTLVK